jgi:ESCRT-II complex subunit VPS36
MQEVALTLLYALILSKEKTVAFDSGRLFLTSHRLVYLDAAEPQRNSRYLDLKHVKQTEYWVGFMKSSPKITLVLGDLDTTEETNGSQEALYEDESLHPLAQTWTCHICGMQNLASKGNKCSLCGIRKADGISTTPSSARSTTFASINGTTSPAQPPVDTRNLISCPSCTYLNHPSMVRCEICESPLGIATSKPSRPSTPSSRPATPALPGQATPTFVRLSFRKGGVQACYAALKKALQAKEWVVDKDSRRRSVPPASGSEIDPTTGHRTTTAGIDGLLRTIDLDARDREDDMQDALSDLEALMARAKEMVSW